MKIVFNGYFYKNEKLKVTQAVKIFSENFKISRNFHFTVHSLNESESKKLNQKTFNKNKPTDVLSFPLYNDIEAINQLDESMHEDMGDMFICRNVIKKNAEIYDKDFVEELQYIVIHGLLHLIGYSHEKNDKLKTYESKLMKKIWNES
ncbi:rRNA maturation RNase YbeY [Candidatus Actinomarina sp. HD9-500m-PIT-SAG01]|nr:rRNA maturation RNase YbeY [Acidimicrobiaceae bacterium]MDC2977417.1 rRNA maturation RNase YbeY [Acidimicrobiaceae bacterium]RDX33007.1 rRNA maturation RNase YbeY [Candidatus Actinomarina sp. HD9-500m-PIT-SAG01]GIS37993.1 MAG: endoribonuclease YbeY [Actinomycetota bacterium]